MKADKKFLRETIADIICCDIEDLKDDTNFKDDIDVNSVQMLEIISSIEDEYDIEIAATNMDKFNTINKIVSEIENMEL